MAENKDVRKYLSRRAEKELKLSRIGEKELKKPKVDFLNSFVKILDHTAKCSVCEEKIKDILQHMIALGEIKNA